METRKRAQARNSAATAEQAAGFDTQAQDDGVSGTPTILVGKTGGLLRTVTLTSPTDSQSVTAAILTALG